ncbi:pirin family protein [Alteromonas macleodii]|jgi:redox-sensitive bicupin YhaK (pirin superfamily)|uniref:Pirin family protein n=1 Tax=Marinobacter sp. MMG032 TaxID=3158548 RepID=A0AAU7MIT8_9GAMM|nr:pirin family protein [Marinobacter sp.]MBO6809583.1 pirin family protein [Marinobacter sp.]MBO6872582.1 pirin family protein [Marinobacter sp.]
MTLRSLKQIIPALETSDGAGVRIKRSIGQQQNIRLDPFLMLDEFGSAEAADYIAGFPSHPHRGFETVTYMIEGHMLHEDHLGNRGDLRNGGVQWMTAGRGIIHSEMPQQEEGVMRGFQLWLNLPAAEKMTEAGYRDIQPEEIPEIVFEGGKVKLIAGNMEIEGQLHEGSVADRSTQPIYADIHLESGASVTLPVPEGHNAMLYLYEGTANLADRALQRSAANILGDNGDRIALTAGESGARLLLIAGKPIGEPVVQYGPFVMNTREEIEQTLRDYRDGRLTA